MKSLNNIKKIAAIVGGVALLGAGMAFASPITLQNVPIINNQGQPVVQVVVGSNAKISDGIAAGNIAAAIGNLAYTSQPVTATVNANSISGLKVSYSSPKYSLSNQQVWLNESGVTSATGASYLFSALIGSVFNQGIQLGALSNTKALQGSSSYSFPESYATTTSPSASPYTGVGSVPVSESVTQSNGDGITFSSFGNTIGVTSGISSYDNLLQVTSSQFSPLLSNSGSNGETESLFLTGFPVYDQQSGVNNFALLDAGGAYQIIFNNPIANRTTSNSININVPIKLLGTTYTIINGTGAGQNLGTSSTYKVGGTIYLASSVTPMQTVYVGKNLSSGPWNVQLQDLAQTQQGTNDAAAVAIYYNGQATNETSLKTGTTTEFNVSGHTLFLNLNSTFAGLYAYQKWAKMQLYTSVYKVQSNQQFNKTNDPGWNAELLWTNTSSTTGPIDQLYGIDIYNVSPTILTPGQSFSFIQNPAAYKLTLLGPTSSSYDPVTAQLSTMAGQNYEIPEATGGGTTITNITEPAQLLTLTSQIQNAFSYAGQESDSVIYDLTPYTMGSLANTGSGAVSSTQAVLTYTDPTAISGGTSTWISQAQPLSVTISGYSQATKTFTEQSATFTYNQTTGDVVSDSVSLNTDLYNVTAIKIQGNRALPIFNGGALSLSIESTVGSTPITLATLSSQPPELLYSLTGQDYYGTEPYTSAVNYNQQNGQPISSVTLAPTAASVTPGAIPHQLYALKVGEVSVPASQTQDYLGAGIYNNTPSSTPMYVLNYSTSGNHGNVTYTSTQGQSISVGTNFRTEKGSKVQSISPSQDTFDMATSIDQLQFSLTTEATNTIGGKSYTEYGPYSIGQVTNLPNVTVAGINATTTYANNSIAPTITGEANLTATASVASAITPTLLKNLGSTSPLVVSDGNANTGGSLILVGSGYVNVLSAQLQNTYNVSITANSPTISGTAYGSNRILVAGYTANETTAAADSFIGQLYAAASSNS